MLVQFLAEAIGLLLGGALLLVEGVIPEVVFDWVGTFFSMIGYLLSFGPASAILAIVGMYYAVDLAINAYVFVITTYKLIPVKST